nr:hypothetical protein [Pandoravirus aubagnensis]
MEGPFRLSLSLGSLLCLSFCCSIKAQSPERLRSPFFYQDRHRSTPCRASRGRAAPSRLGRRACVCALVISSFSTVFSPLSFARGIATALLPSLFFAGFPCWVALTRTRMPTRRWPAPQNYTQNGGLLRREACAEKSRKARAKPRETKKWRHKK